MENSYEGSLFWKQQRNRKKDDLDGEYYKSVFSGLPIRTIHDCSCGSGNITFPLHYMGYEVSGSDISENMISLAKERAENENLKLKFFQADFLDLEKHLTEPVDCFISTGNSIPHVPNGSVEKLFSQASKLIRKRGYLYFDIRNWDKILRDRQRFFPYDMNIHEGGYTLLLQVWDYNGDGSVTFNFLIHKYDGEGKLSGRQYQQIPPYYPLKLKAIEEFLGATGFEIIQKKQYNPYGKWGDEDSKRIDIIESEEDFMKVDWYSLLAQKRN